jgi:hypothetical protein
MATFKKKDYITGIVVFVLFLGEAMMHYGIGKEGKICFIWPGTEDMFRMASVVAVFTVLSVLITKGLEVVLIKK